MSYYENCPDYGPDAGHYYGDEDTGEYRPFCSCGHADPFVPRDTRKPGRPLPGPNEPPF